jgi:hypothetical protein
MRISPGARLTKPVILSGVNAPQSEAFTQSKDPISACSSTSTARSSHYALYQAPREFLAVLVALITGTVPVGRTLLSVAFDIEVACGGRIILSECPFQAGIGILCGIQNGSPRSLKPRKCWHCLPFMHSNRLLLTIVCVLPSYSRYGVLTPPRRHGVKS